MNYKRIYNELIQRGQQREKSPDGYCEIHHISPRCLGGNDDPANLVNLSAREHFIAHWLLVRMYQHTDHYYKLLYAFCMMKSKNGKQQRYHFSSRLYATYKSRWKHTDDGKRKMSESHTGKTLSEETKQKISNTRKQKFEQGLIQRMCNEDNPSFGRPVSEETRSKMSISRKGRKDSEDTIAKKRSRMLENNHMKGGTHTAEARQKISKALKGRPQSEEHKINKSRSTAGKIHMYLPSSGERHLVKPQDVEKMTSLGYVRGIKPVKPKPTKMTPRKGPSSGKRWMHHPQSGDKLMVLIEDVDSFLAMGYHMGMK